MLAHGGKTQPDNKISTSLWTQCSLKPHKMLLHLSMFSSTAQTTGEDFFQPSVFNPQFSQQIGFLLNGVILTIKKL